jgi:Transglutaminase-like superfamily
MTERWRSRLRTAEAMAALSCARLLVATLWFGRWRGRLGHSAGSNPSRAQVCAPEQLAAHVEWAARRLPFSTKCLPRAMALSWMLRARGVDHCVVFAVRPSEQRDTDDHLHAWVEVGGEPVLGDLPGPWIETLRLGT